MVKGPHPHWKEKEKRKIIQYQQLYLLLEIQFKLSSRLKYDFFPDNSID